MRRCVIVLMTYSRWRGLPARRAGAFNSSPGYRTMLAWFCTSSKAAIINELACMPTW